MSAPRVWSFTVTALLAMAAARAAEPAAAPATRVVSTPSGWMLVSTAAQPASAAARVPDTDVQQTPGGPMLVLRDRSNANAAANANATASTTARLAATPSPSWPANARAEALPNGAQMLVLPAPVAQAPLAPQRVVVDIDPAKAGTRPVDVPRNDVLYRQRPEASPR